MLHTIAHWTFTQLITHIEWGVEGSHNHELLNSAYPLSNDMNSLSAERQKPVLDIKHKWIILKLQTHTENGEQRKDKCWWVRFLFRSAMAIEVIHSWSTRPPTHTLTKAAMCQWYLLTVQYDSAFYGLTGQVLHTFVTLFLFRLNECTYKM